MIDTSMIELDDLIEQESSTRFGKASGNGTKRTRKGSCPWCGGTDRFAVLTHDNPQHFYCGIHRGSGCDKHGDAIGFIMQWHNKPFLEAVKYLQDKGYAIQLPEYNGIGPAKVKKREPRMEVNLDVAPSDTWAMAAQSFSHTCQNILWSQHGSPALKWLRDRGFTDETIRSRGYGYNPKEDFIDIAEWDVHEGKKVWLPRGIVIPWAIGGSIWKISIRRGDADLKRDAAQGKSPNKYIAVKGGSNGLYRADTIQPGQPLVIFEGEFNADILAQVLAAADVSNVAIVATGSTGKGRADNWLVKIAKASPILISFDPDGAGAKAAKDYWSKVLPQALLWPSTGGDLNDMFLAGKDVVKWLNRGLKLAGIELVKPLPAKPLEPVYFSAETESTPQTPQGMPTPETVHVYPGDVEEYYLSHNLEFQSIGCLKVNPSRAHTQARLLPYWRTDKQQWLWMCAKCHPMLNSTNGKYRFESELAEAI